MTNYALRGSQTLCMSQYILLSLLSTSSICIVHFYRRLSRGWGCLPQRVFTSFPPKSNLAIIFSKIAVLIQTDQPLIDKYRPLHRKSETVIFEYLRNVFGSQNMVEGIIIIPLRSLWFSKYGYNYNLVQWILFTDRETNILQIFKK